jgi:hypothetical protein
MGCGTFAQVGGALLCFVALGGRFATDIPRVGLTKNK